MLQSLTSLPNHQTQISEYEELPYDEETTAVVQNVEVNCDRCKEDKMATCYCLTCDRKLCQQHEEVCSCITYTLL